MVDPPLLAPGGLERLWNNTVGFLVTAGAAGRNSASRPERGVLLLGEPGNGKTMAARWLRSECQASRVQLAIGGRPSGYAEATRSGEANQLFQSAESQDWCCSTMSILAVHDRGAIRSNGR